jgi:radical SAM superfamily enzyme YgiQ (UPF0313 family)
MHQISMENQVPLINCLGILALSSSLKRENIEVDILDLSRFAIGAASDFDPLIEDIVESVLSSNPHVLGLSTMSNNLVIALEICQRVKKDHPEIVTILGGPGASFIAREIISLFKQIDIVIRGEADLTFPELIKHMQAGNITKPIRGVVGRNEEEISDNGWPEPVLDLDSLPIPNYELCCDDIDNDEAVNLEVGRGCPFACVFCSTSSFFQRKFRVKSVNRVLEEIRLIQKTFGKRRVKMNHDLLTYNREYILSLCYELSRLDPLIEWGCSARLDTLDKDLLRRMKQAGCDRIYIGIEALTNRMQRKINKRLNLTKLDDILEIAIELNFTMILSFIIGIPDETSAEIDALWAFILRAKSINPLRVLIQVHSLVPEQGSRLFDTMKESLVYDDYGGPGHSDFPPIQWTHLRELIKKHPEIFPTYHFIYSPSIQRQNILRQIFLGHIVDGPAMCSILFAYSVFGEKVARTLVNRIDEMDLPLPQWPMMDYRATMESVRKIILELYEEDDDRALQFDAIAKAEIAVADVTRKKPDYYEYIEVFYHPIHLMRKILKLEYDPSQLVKQSRTLFVCWNERTNTVAYTELKSEVAALRNKLRKL